MKKTKSRRVTAEGDAKDHTSSGVPTPPTGLVRIKPEPIITDLDDDDATVPPRSKGLSISIKVLGERQNVVTCLILRL